MAIRSSTDYALVEAAPAEWAAFVARHPSGHLLQLPAWGALKGSTGWEAIRVAVAAPDSAHKTTILAGAQLLFQKRFGLSVAYVPRGPLWAGEPLIDDLLTGALERLARRRRAIFLRIEPNITEDEPGADELHTRLLLRGCLPAGPIQPRSSIHVDLRPPTERIFAGFSKGHRADIRRAERNGVQVRCGKRDDLVTFYNIMQATGTRAAFAVHTEHYYDEAWRLFEPDSRLLIAELDGQAVAAHLVFNDGHNGLYLYSGANEAGLKSGANHLLEWHAIQWARERGCTRYDLWGIPDAFGRAATVQDPERRAALEAEAQNDALAGVYRFKKGFGGSVVRYLPAYDRVFIPPLYQLWQRQRRWS